MFYIKSAILKIIQIASETLKGQEPVEKTLSVLELIRSGGLAGQLIIMILKILSQNNSFKHQNLCESKNAKLTNKIN